MSQRTTARKAVDATQGPVASSDPLIAILCHELRNPLMGIMAAAELLVSPECHAERARRAAEVIMRQAQRISAVLEALDSGQLTTTKR
jgi:nitrogen-specific signal transduction histidine kinase